MKCTRPLPTPFDNYEISSVRRYGQGADSFCEQVNDDEAEFWSLYGHIPGAGLDCIGDFKTREHAEEVYSRITSRYYEKLSADVICSIDLSESVPDSEERILTMKPHGSSEAPSDEVAHLLDHLDKSLVRADEFGCLVGLSEDRSTIFTCALNTDGSPDQHPHYSNCLNWSEVTAPDESFLDFVNQAFGTHFHPSGFAMR